MYYFFTFREDQGFFYRELLSIYKEDGQEVDKESEENHRKELYKEVKIGDTGVHADKHILRITRQCRGGADIAGGHKTDKERDRIKGERADYFNKKRGEEDADGIVYI